VLKPGNDQVCGAVPGSLPVLPASDVSNGQLVCGATPPAPQPASVRPVALLFLCFVFMH